MISQSVTRILDRRQISRSRLLKSTSDPPLLMIETISASAILVGALTALRLGFEWFGTALDTAAFSKALGPVSLLPGHGEQFRYAHARQGF